MYCIQESDKPKFFFRMFNIVQLVGNKIILPIKGDEQLSTSKSYKLARRTKNILDKTISKKIVISKNIQKQIDYIDMLVYYDFEISDGKWLFEVLSCKILDTIIWQKKLKKEETSISILVNDLTESTISNIEQIAKEYKRVNIITNNINKFKKIEEQILKKDGIMITVGNNKKKGLAKSKIILNIDFPQELLSEYNIYENAIIINIRENVKITKKRFSGIVVNDYEITYREEDDYDCDKDMKYKQCDLYEAQMNKKQSFKNIMKEIEADKVKIKKLEGIGTF